MKKGKIYLIGAGPFDADLITVKGMKILNQADVIIYDYLVNPEILKYGNPDAEKICAQCSDRFSKRHALINKLMIEKVKQGKRVVHLKNGDPFIFGRANEELTALKKAGIEFAVVPGITAAIAASCYSGIPLTSRGLSSSVVFITGHQAIKRKMPWQHIAKIDTIVIYMGAENLKKILEKFIKYGLNSQKPIAIISNATKFNQKIIVSNLKNVLSADLKILPPSIIIIGDVVKKEKEFNWFKKTKKILFTGISPERFFEDGLIFHIPMIKIKPVDDYSELDFWIKKLNISNINYKPIIDWIVFSSRFGVYYFFDRLFKLGFDSRILKNIKIAAIGSSTANKLKECGIIADLVPKNESSVGLIGEFKKIRLSIPDSNLTILLPHSNISDKGLAMGLQSLGFIVHSVVVYENVMPDNLPDLDLNFFDEIIFSSPSTVRNFIKKYGLPPKSLKIKTIGPVTEREVRKFNLL